MKRIDLSTPAFHRNAHAHFARMRETAPVYPAQISRWRQAYIVTRYADVDALLKGDDLVKDPDTIRDRPTGRRAVWLPEAIRALMNNMLTSDEPAHRRLRTLVQQAFTPRSIAALEPDIETLAHELLDAAPRDEPFDLIAHYSRPLPARVIAALIGVPASEQADFQRWTADILRPPTPLNALLALRPLRQFTRYIAELADRRRGDPQADLMTRLVEAETAGDQLSESELVSMVVLLLTAGHETTMSLVANGTLALLQHPEQLVALREQPERLDRAIEELLRYDGPLTTTEIYHAARDLELHGVAIPRGAVVLPALLSANRDAQAFCEPDRLDLERTPNRHLAFGRGIHYCLGAPLARLEARVAFRVLLARRPQLRLAAEASELRHVGVAMLNRLEALPVRG